MMMRSGSSVHGLIAALAVGGACASWGVRVLADTPASARTDAPAIDPERALLALEEIQPVPAPPEQRAEPLAPLPERAQQAIERANALRDERRYTEATIELEKALRYAADDPRVHRALAITQWEAGDVQRVERHVAAALKSGDDDVVGQYLRGRLAARRFDNAEALRAFRLALLCSHDESTRDYVALAEYHLAETLLAEGYVSAAIEVYQRFERSLAEAAKDVAELEALGRAVPQTAPERLAAAYALLGRFAEAADHFQRAYPEGSMRPADQRRYVELLMAAERNQEALTIARALLVEDASAVDLFTQVHVRLGDPAAAIADLERLVAEHPENAPLTQALARALQAAGREAEAVAVLRESAQAVPGSAALRWALFDTLVAQQDWASAILAVAAAIVADADAAADVEGRLRGLPTEACGVEMKAASGGEAFALAYVQGVLADRCGAADRAMGEFERAIAAKPDFTLARVHLARLQLDRFAWDAAIATAHPPDVDLPDDSQLEYVLGQAKMGIGEIDQAAEHLRNAVRLNRANSEAMITLALLYRGKGEHNRSLRQLQSLVELDPLNERGRELLLTAYLADNDRRAAARQLEELRRIAASPTCIARCVVRMEYRPDTVDLQQMRRTLEAAIAAHRPDAETLHMIALAYMDERRFAEAADSLEQALALDPGHRESAELLVTAYRANLEFEKALAQRRLLMGRYPNRPDWRQDELELLLIVQRFDEVIAVTDAWLAESDVSDELAEALRETQITTSMLAEDYDAALTLIEGIRARDPGDVRHLRRHIAILQRVGQHDRALELIQRWPQDVPEGFASGGTSLIWNGLPKSQHETLVQLVLESVEKDPERDALNLALIELLVAVEDYSGALALAKAHAQVSRFGAVFDDLRVEILDAAGRVDEAIDAVKEQLITTPENEMRLRLNPYELRQRLVQLLIKAGKMDQARDELHRWLAELSQRQQGEMDARQGRADIDTMKAERMFYLGLLASVHLEAGDLVESVQTLELVLELDPNDIGTSNDLGYSLADTGQQLDRAETLARYAVANEPRNSAFLDSLGWVLYKKGDVAGAKHWLTLARFAGAKMTQQSRFAGAGEDPVVCDHLGDACWRLGDKAEAQKWWQQSVEFAGESLDTAGPSRTYERTLQSVRAKLAAAASGGEPAVAELGENVEE